MVVGYSDPIDGCTDGSSYRENPDELKMAVIDDNAVVQKETSLIPNNVPAKIVDICSRTTADKDKDVETTVDVYSSSEESTAECESSSEDGDGVLELAKNNQTNQMVNQMKECKDFMVATNVHITNNYPPQPLSLDVEQLKNLADGNIYKSLWADDANLDESIEKAQAKVSYPFVKALAMAVTTTLVLVIVVVGLLLWQMKLSDSEGSTDSGYDEEWTGNTTLVTRDQWNAEEPQQLTDLLSVIPPKMVVLAHTAGRTCPTATLSCKDFVRLIEGIHIGLGWNDIAYNFLVGGDGLVYAGTGWNRQGHHSLDRNNNKSVAIALIGDFNKKEPTPEQMAAAEAVVSVGVSLGKLDLDSYVVFQGQIRPFLSPGKNVEKIVKQQWPLWSPLGDIDVKDQNDFSRRFFNRSNWFAMDPASPFTEQLTMPLHSVLIYQTEDFNITQRNSLMTMRELQNYYKAKGFIDVPSNFLIFADGCIYEGRGWNYIGESITQDGGNISLKFVLRVELVSLENSSQRLTQEMNNSLLLLLEEGVKIGKLVSNYNMYEYDSYTLYRRWLTPLP